MTELEIIGQQSIFVRAARMVCEEKGVANRLTPARPHSPEVDCIHTFGKIPVIRYGDFHLFESKAIATFVDRAFPGPSRAVSDRTNQSRRSGDHHTQIALLPDVTSSWA